MEPLVVTNSKTKFILLLLLSLGFVAIAIFILSIAKTATDTLIGVSTLLVFGGCAGLCVWQLLDSRPRLRIDDEGVCDRTLRVGLIPWPEITGAYIAVVQNHHYVCLKLRNPDLWTAKLSRLMRAAIEANKLVGMTELSLNLTGTNANAKEILDTILSRIDSSQPKALAAAEVNRW